MSIDRAADRNDCSALSNTGRAGLRVTKGLIFSFCLVVNFIAVLELVKEGLVKVSQEAAYQPIYVRLALV